MMEKWGERYRVWESLKGIEGEVQLHGLQDDSICYRFAVHWVTIHTHPTTHVFAIVLVDTKTITGN